MKNKKLLILVVFVVVVAIIVGFAASYLYSFGENEARFRQKNKSDFLSQFNVDKDAEEFGVKYFNSPEEVRDYVEFMYEGENFLILEIIDGYEGNANVHIIINNLKDDSVDSIEKYYSLGKDGDKWYVKEVLSRVMCQSGRGPQEWTKEKCL